MISWLTSPKPLHPEHRKWVHNVQTKGPDSRRDLIISDPFSPRQYSTTFNRTREWQSIFVHTAMANKYLKSKRPKL